MSSEKQQIGPLSAEQRCAQRIRAERERQGLSLERLAEKMGAAGRPMDRTAIHRIEKGNPPKRITVNDLEAFAKVLGVSINSLVIPDDVARSRTATRLYKKYLAARDRFLAAADEVDALEVELLRLHHAGYIEDGLDSGFDGSVIEALRGEGETEPEWLLENWQYMPVHDRLQEDLEAHRAARQTKKKAD